MKNNICYGIPFYAKVHRYINAFNLLFLKKPNIKHVLINTSIYVGASASAQYICSMNMYNSIYVIVQYNA